jgi:D-hexose-6-phosphate mutarotase
MTTESRVETVAGQGDLPMVRIQTRWSVAEIYLQGATVTHFQKHGEPPLLFLSAKSRFEKDAPIRGGIPVIFPWFGKPADKPGQHGFVRSRVWEFAGSKTNTDGSVVARFTLACPEFPSVGVEYFVTVSDTLTVELIVKNGPEKVFVFENCLHTYFVVGDIHQTSVAGLQGVSYLDALENFARKTEREESIRFTAETDRVYVNTPHTTEIHDAALHRVIRVQKENSNSTVVWNPWIEKSKRMVDYGDDEYLRMVCVESGNVRAEAIKLSPGATASLRVKLSSSSLN